GAAPPGPPSSLRPAFGCGCTGGADAGPEPATVAQASAGESSVGGEPSPATRPATAGKGGYVRFAEASGTGRSRWWARTARSVTSRLSPTGIRASTSARSQAAVPWSTGSPVGSGHQRTPANRSTPRRANCRATSSWSAARKLTTSDSAASTAGRDDDVAAREKARSGGSADTEITDVAVKPTGPSGERSVTTATPAGWWRNTCLNCAGVTPAESSRTGRAGCSTLTPLLRTRPGSQHPARAARGRVTSGLPRAGPV